MEIWRKEMGFDGEGCWVDGDGGAPEGVEAFEREEVREAAGIVLRRRKRHRTRRGVGGNGGRRR